MWNVAIALLLVLVFLYGLDRLGLWAGRHNWIYYRNNPRKPGAGLGLLAKIYQPSLEHVVEEKASEAVRAEQDESGAGPLPGDGVNGGGKDAGEGGGPKTGGSPDVPIGPSHPPPGDRH